MKMSAFTAAQVTGNLNVIEWSDLARKWEYLRGIEFWRVGPRLIVDIRIGLEYVDCIIRTDTYVETPENPLRD